MTPVKDLDEYLRISCSMMGCRLIVFGFLRVWVAS